MSDIGILVGIGFAILVLVCCLIVAIMLWYRRNKTKTKSRKSSSGKRKQHKLQTAIKVSAHEYKPTITDTRDLDDLDLSDRTTDEDILGDDNFVDLYDNEGEALAPQRKTYQYKNNKSQSAFNSQLNRIQEETDTYNKHLTKAARHEPQITERKSESDSDDYGDSISELVGNDRTIRIEVAPSDMAPSILSELPIAPPKHDSPDTEDSVSDTSHTTDDDRLSVPDDAPHLLAMSTLSELPMAKNESADTEDSVSDDSDDSEDIGDDEDSIKQKDYATYDQMISNLTTATSPREVAVSALSELPMAQPKNDSTDTEDSASDEDMISNLNMNFAPSELALSALSELPMAKPRNDGADTDSASESESESENKDRGTTTVQVGLSEMALSALSELPLAAPNHDSSDTKDSASDSTEYTEDAKRGTNGNEESVSELIGTKAVMHDDEGSLSSLLGDNDNNRRHQNSISELQ